jgi:hypothetical protein
MGCVAAAGQQDERPAGTAPIEDFEPDVIAGGYESGGVRRRIFPGGGGLGVE